MHKPAVSILIPCFNQKDSINRAIESALAQSYPNLEVVVADDKSTDGSWESLQKYQNSNCIRLTRNPKNLGRVKNHRHLLYDLANGDFVMMLDGDDCLIDNEFVADAVKLAQDFSLGLVFAEAKAQNVKDGQIRPVNFPFDKTGLIPFQEIFRRGVLFMHGAVLYRRDLALKYDFYSKEILADDNESFLRFIVGEKVGFIKQMVYLYQWDNSPERYSLQLRIENTLMIESVYQFALEKCPHEKKLFDWWRERMLSTLFYGNLINLLSHGQTLPASKFFLTYLKKHSFQKLLAALKHPILAYQWGKR